MSAQTDSLNTAIAMILPLLKSKGMRENIATKINAAIDIPMINEQTEGKIIKKLIKLLVKALEDMTEPDSDDE